MPASLSFSATALNSFSPGTSSTTWISRYILVCCIDLHLSLCMLSRSARYCWTDSSLSTVDMNATMLKKKNICKINQQYYMKELAIEYIPEKCWLIKHYCDYDTLPIKKMYSSSGSVTGLCHHCSQGPSLPVGTSLNCWYMHHEKRRCLTDLKRRSPRTKMYWTIGIVSSQRQYLWIWSQWDVFELPTAALQSSFSQRENT